MIAAESWIGRTCSFKASDTSSGSCWCTAAELASHPKLVEALRFGVAAYLKVPRALVNVSKIMDRPDLHPTDHPGVDAEKDLEGLVAFLALAKATSDAAGPSDPTAPKDKEGGKAVMVTFEVNRGSVWSLQEPLRLLKNLRADTGHAKRAAGALLSSLVENGFIEATAVSLIGQPSVHAVPSGSAGFSEAALNAAFPSAGEKAADGESGAPGCCGPVRKAKEEHAALKKTADKALNDFKNAEVTSIKAAMAVKAADIAVITHERAATLKLSPGKAGKANATAPPAGKPAQNGTTANGTAANGTTANGTTANGTTANGGAGSKLTGAANAHWDWVSPKRAASEAVSEVRGGSGGESAVGSMKPLREVAIEAGIAAGIAAGSEAGSKTGSSKPGSKPGSMAGSEAAAPTAPAAPAAPVAASEMTTALRKEKNAAASVGSESLANGPGSVSPSSTAAAAGSGSGSAAPTVGALANVEQPRFARVRAETTVAVGASAAVRELAHIEASLKVAKAREAEASIRVGELQDDFAKTTQSRSGRLAADLVRFEQGVDRTLGHIHAAPADADVSYVENSAARLAGQEDLRFRALSGNSRSTAWLQRESLRRMRKVSRASQQQKARRGGARDQPPPLIDQPPRNGTKIAIATSALAALAQADKDVSNSSLGTMASGPRATEGLEAALAAGGPGAVHGLLPDLVIPVLLKGVVTMQGVAAEEVTGAMVDRIKEMLSKIMAVETKTIATTVNSLNETLVAIYNGSLTADGKPAPVLATPAPKGPAPKPCGGRVSPYERGVNLGTAPCTGGSILLEVGVGAGAGAEKKAEDKAEVERRRRKKGTKVHMGSKVVSEAFASGGRVRATVGGGLRVAKTVTASELLRLEGMRAIAAASVATHTAALSSARVDTWRRMWRRAATGPPAAQVSYTVRMDGQETAVASSKLVAEVQDDQFRLHIWNRYLKQVGGGFDKMTELQLGTPTWASLVHSQRAALQRAVTDARAAVRALNESTTGGTETADMLPSATNARLHAETGRVEAPSAAAPTGCHKALNCVDCANSVDCGWCSSTRTCVEGSFTGSQGEGVKSAGCPAVFPAATADTKGGTPENWIFNPQVRGEAREVRQGGRRGRSVRVCVERGGASWNTPVVCCHLCAYAGFITICATLSLVFFSVL